MPVNRSRSLKLVTLLSFAAVGACSPPAGTVFQREGKAFKGLLNANAKSTDPKLADAQLAIGVIEDGRGKRNLTYVPFALHVPQGGRVSFVSWDGAFTLTLKRSNDAQPWPFAEPEATLNSTGTPALQSVTMTVARDARPDGYNFRVTLSVPAAPGRPGETIEDRYCPSIIIDAVVSDTDGGLPGLDGGVLPRMTDAGY